MSKIITPQEYIDSDFAHAVGSQKMIVTRYLNGAQAAAAVMFMTGSNGMVMQAFAKPVSDWHIYYAAKREAKKGKTPPRSSTWAVTSTR